MQRASDLLGLPVADANNNPLGTVGGILVDFARERLGALLITDKNFAEPGLIPAEDIAFGPEALTVSADAIIRGNGAIILRQGKFTLEEACKLSVVTNSGNKLGNVADLILDGIQLVALELSDGLLQDVFEGRNVLPLPLSADLAEEKFIAPDGAGLKTPNSSGEWQFSRGL